MRKPTLISAALVFLALALLAVWAGVAVGVDDALWFLPVFRANAAYIDLYWDGQQLRLEPGSADYERLNQALQTEIPRIRSYPTGAGLSEVTLEQLRSEGRLLEAHYTHPVRVHSRYHFSATRVLYIPLSGHHARFNRVFNIGRGVPLELHSVAGIIAAAEMVAQGAGSSAP